MFLITNLPIYVAYWVFVGVAQVLLTGHFKVKKFSFSVRNYYLFVIVFALPIVIQAWTSGSIVPLVYVALLGLAGVIGETLASIWWHQYYGQRLWVYAVETVFHKYTSWLNFIPWGIGGLLYLHLITNVAVLQGITQLPNTTYVFGTCMALCFIFQYSLFHMFRRGKFHHVTPANTLFFFAPVAILVIVLGAMYGPLMYALAAGFAIVPTLAEYLFGKATEFFISKKMWTYTYVLFDRGHFTPLSIPLFILGGFYFLAVGSILSGSF